MSPSRLQSYFSFSIFHYLYGSISEYKIICLVVAIIIISLTISTIVPRFEFKSLLFTLEKWIKSYFWVFWQRLHSVRQTESKYSNENLKEFLSDLIASYPRKRQYKPPGQECQWPEEFSNYSQPCFNVLCTTYQLPNNTKCPDPRLVDYGPFPGCVCVDGWAQISPGECAEIGSCECPAASDQLNPELYDLYDVPTIAASRIRIWSIRNISPRIIYFCSDFEEIQ